DLFVEATGPAGEEKEYDCRRDYEPIGYLLPNNPELWFYKYRGRGELENGKKQALRIIRRHLGSTCDLKNPATASDGPCRLGRGKALNGTHYNVKCGRREKKFVFSLVCCPIC